MFEKKNLKNTLTDQEKTILDDMYIKREQKSKIILSREVTMLEMLQAKQ